MKLQIPVNDDYALEVTFQNVEPAIRPATAQRSTSRRVTEKPNSAEPEQATPVSAAPPAPATTQQSAPQPSEELPGADQTDSDQPDADGLPAEIRQLPPKQIEFYHRKLAEYREIYPEDKARTMALAIVQQVAGLR